MFLQDFEATREAANERVDGDTRRYGQHGDRHKEMWNPAPTIPVAVHDDPTAVAECEGERSMPTTDPLATAIRGRRRNLAAQSQDDPTRRIIDREIDFEGLCDRFCKAP